MPAEAAFCFRPLTAADLPMVDAWLRRPHWQEWWGEPETEMAFIVAMVEERDSSRPFVIELRGEPVGYIQRWLVRHARTEPWLTEAPWVAWLPDEAVGVDLSLADGDRLGRGLGSAALAAFVAHLRAEGHRTIVVDPDPANRRAVRAYEKAGFRPIPALLGRTGNTLLMQHHAEEARA
jgi:aminoglycoside 6'-N-acetyltransferase